jgi:hypothetical protein
MADIPHCLSEFESGDATCNGDSDADTAWERKACGWRNRCAGFAEQLQITGRDADHYLSQRASINDDGEEEYFAALRSGRNQVRFETFLDKLIEKFRIVNGEITARPKPPKEKVKKKAPKKRRGFGHKAKLSSVRMRKANFEKRTKATQALAKQFRNEIARAVKGYRVVSPGKAISPGEIYSYFSENLRFLVVCLKVVRGIDKSIARIVCKPHSVLVDIYIAVDIDEFTKAVGVKATKKLLPERIIRGGQYGTKLRRLDRGKIGLVAATLGNLVDKGIIELPEPR